jgi:hypothetical protein
MTPLFKGVRLETAYMVFYKFLQVGGNKQGARWVSCVLVTLLYAVVGLS